MCTPSGRGTLALQEQIWGQLGVNRFFPHWETLFFGGQLGKKFTHLEPSWCQLGSTWIPFCLSKPTWANLEWTWANLETQTSIKSNKKCKLQTDLWNKCFFQYFEDSGCSKMSNFGSKFEESWPFGGLGRCVPVIFWDFEPTLSQHRRILRPTWANLNQHDSTWPNLI